MVEKLQSIKHKTPEMEAYLAVGYGMNLKKAKLIIKERGEDPHLWPYEEYQKALAFIEAYNGVPTP